MTFTNVTHAKYLNTWKRKLQILSGNNHTIIVIKCAKYKVSKHKDEWVRKELSYKQYKLVLWKNQIIKKFLSTRK